MISALITATLAAIGYSLWVRRHTWRSRWEADASLNIALLGFAVLLLSPWASVALGPRLHRFVGWWNVEDLFGHLCLIAAVTAIIHHGLTRHVDESQAHRLFRRQILVPAWLGVPLLVAVFIIADADYNPDLLPAHIGNLWLSTYWLVLGGTLTYLLSYAGRVLLILRADHRSTGTVDLYLISAAFGVAAIMIPTSTAWVRIDVTLPVWLCACLGAIGFAYGSARSWHAKMAWFTSGDNPPPQAIPPQESH
jgi:hypothetical protein